MPATRRYRARGWFYLLAVGLFGLMATVVLLIALGYSFRVRPLQITKHGLLVLDSAPANAYITINNKLRPERTNTRVKLAPGSYHVKVDKPDTLPWETNVDILPGGALLEQH